METLLKLPPGKSRQIVRHVLRDPKFTPQLYFLTTEKQDDGSLALLFEQTVSNTQGDQITSRVFFKHQLTIPPSTALHCAIDEKGRWLYVVDNIGTRLLLERFRLKYQKPDLKGYRHAGVPNLHIECHQCLTALINTCPSPTQLILHCKFLANCFRPYFEVCQDRQFIKGLGLKRRYKMPRYGPVSELFDQWMRKEGCYALQLTAMETRSHLFSRSNDLLVLISYHVRLDIYPYAKTKDELRLLDRCMILYSYNTQMQLINILKIDPVQLLQSFLPKTLLDGLKTSCAPALVPDFMFFGANLELLGRVHKYVLFFFHNKHVLAAKWPKDWYKMQQVPEVKRSKVICVVDKQKRQGHVLGAWLGSTDLYLKVQKSGGEAIRRMSLGHKFKDYRMCAFCGKEEKRKRRNKEGKRVSSFKVCRMCKELNLHKSYANASPGCHYCSFECEKKHWKEHKLVHSGRQRKIEK